MLSVILLPLLVTASTQQALFLAVGAGADGTPVRGTIVRLAGDSADLSTATGNVKLANLVSLRRAGMPLPPFPAGPMLISAAGDRVPGKLTGGDDRSLEFQATLGRDNATTMWRVPYSAAAAVWLITPPAETTFDPAKYSWRGDDRKDVLLFRNGDVVRGTLEQLTADGHVQFKITADPNARNHSLSQISAIAFNPALVRVRKPKEAYVHVVLANGARLDLAGAAIEGSMLQGKTLFGAAVRVPLADLIALDVRQGKATPLAEVKPKSVEQTDYLGASRPPTTDRPLRLPTPHGDSTHDSALGTAPRTRLVYDLAGKYARFDALVGLDAGIREGSAKVQVLVDGKVEVNEALTPGISRAISLPVRGAKELTLVVDFGPSGGVQAAVNWGDARLVE